MKAKVSIEDESAKPTDYQQACESVSSEIFGLPYCFLEDQQKLSISELIAVKYSLLVIAKTPEPAE